MKQVDMPSQDATDRPEPDWRALEQAALETVKSVAQTIVDRVNKVTREAEAQVTPPADSTAEPPPAE